ncbi:MAG: efflux RND transporter periplasmic adaptor subunit [Candidatus Omnitrophota bacterium]|nr:efflux RND transporter periplasmic adaptor subunit [Candidatus Omnitrophota bacterium]
MKIKKAVIFLIIAHIVGIFFLKRIFFSKPADKETSFKGKGAAIEALTVRAVSLKREDLDLVFSYVGNIKARSEARVYSKVNGKLDSYVLNEGDKVQKDETVALVERDETGLKYELAKVSSPIYGIVGKVFLDKGENILAQSTPVALVVDALEVVVRIGIPEQDISYISKGLKAMLKLDSYPGEVFTGEVSKASEVLDAATRTLDVEIILANPDNKLKSGMFARIDILAGKRERVLALPQDALSKEDSSYYAFVVEGGKAKKVKVEIGISNDKVEILKGLEENQKVIVFGQQGLRDGALVKVAE